MNFDELLDLFKRGEVDAAELKRRLLSDPVLHTECARLDTGRTLRTNHPEVVYCESKTPEQVRSIFGHLYEHSGRVLGTRAGLEHYEAVRDMGARHDPSSRLLTLSDDLPEPKGRVVVASAGTADLPVAEEAAGTLEFMGSEVLRHYDCGVAGIHRLLDAAPDLASAHCVVAVAGMDGALGAVIGGLCSAPVIAVPTSVGYGAAFGGIAPLLTMLNSCAPGVSVVNIDNGFGAGFQAHLINMQSCTD